MMGHYLNQAFRTPIEPISRDEIGPEIFDDSCPFLWLAMSIWLAVGLFLFFGLGWSWIEVLATAVSAYVASDDPWDRE